MQLAHETDPARAREVERYVDTYYPAYRDGHLLVKGGLADQPARYLEILGVIAAVDSQVQQKALELAKENGDE